MKKITAFALALITLFALVSCTAKVNDNTVTKASEEQTAAEAAEETAEEKKEDASILDGFIEDGKIYFDLKISDESIKDFSLKTGEETFAESKQIAFNKDDAITVNGEIVEGAKFYVYVIRKYQSEGASALEKFISVGLRADKLSDYLAKIYTRLSNSTKIYFAILETADGWNHELDAKLNNYITSIKPAE